MTVLAYTVDHAAGPVQAREYEPTPPSPLEVDVALTHSGVCQTDLGMIDDHYGQARRGRSPLRRPHLHAL